VCQSDRHNEDESAHWFHADLIKVIDPSELREASLEAMYDLPFLKEQFT